MFGFFKGLYAKLLPANGIEFANGIYYTYGASSPEGVLTAPVGSVYVDTTNGIIYSKISGTGNTGWSATASLTTMADGTAAAPGLPFASDTDTGLYSPGANRMGFVANGVQQAEVNTGGLYAPGHIVQSIYSSNSYQTSTTGTTYTDVLSALGVTWEIAITPKSATSVIDLMANFQYFAQRAADICGGGILIQRKIGAGAYSTIYTPVSDANGPKEFYLTASGVPVSRLAGRHPIIFRDSPATTDVVTYKFQFRNYVGVDSPSLTINQDTTTDGQSFVFLNEVAA